MGADITRPIHPHFAPDGPFQLGEPIDFDVVERDFPTEYSAVEYVAVATLGRPVAVGHVAFAIPNGPGAWVCFDVGVAIVPARGIWLLVPVFGKWDSAVATAARDRDVLRKVFGDAGDAFPIETAYVPVLGTMPRDPPQRLDACTIYDASLFEAVETNLRARPGIDATEIDRTIEALLQAGHWIDAKGSRLDCLDGNLPRWLAERLPDIA